MVLKLIFKIIKEKLLYTGVKLKNYFLKFSILYYIAPTKDVVQILISNGAEVNIQDFKGKTPLHYGKL